MAYIDIIQLEQAEGHLKEIYDDLIKSRGKLAEIHKVHSLNPPALIHHMDLYMTIMFGRSPLKRVQRELMGVVVSQANQCKYCQVHHAEAVNHYWKDHDRIQSLLRNWMDLQLPFGDQVLCQYAWELSKNPEKAANAALITPLKEAGFNDRAILDATLVISYFNFVNRIVMGLGVALEEKPGGYKYD